MLEKLPSIAERDGIGRRGNNSAIGTAPGRFFIGVERTRLAGRLTELGNHLRGHRHRVGNLKHPANQVGIIVDHFKYAPRRLVSPRQTRDFGSPALRLMAYFTSTATAGCTGLRRGRKSTGS